MPALLQIVLAVSQMALAAPQLPSLNTEPSCLAASRGAAATGTRNEDACRRDESAAHDTLQREWQDFTSEQKSHCVRLAKLGGPPSYVELLTCLEMARHAAQAADTGRPPAAGKR